PLVAFLLSGTTARQMTESVEGILGVMASYAQGPGLRVVATGGAEDDLLRVAALHDARVDRVAMRLEDVVPAFVGRSCSPVATCFPHSAGILCGCWPSRASSRCT